MKKLWVVLSMIFIGACSSTPEGLRVSDDVILTEFANTRAFPAENVGRTARWGGVIASVQNNANNTMIEVVNFELNSSLRPRQRNETQGRFRLYFQGLLDPVIYKQGKSISALGTIDKSEQGKIGEHEYLYPVLKATNVHLWKDISRVEVRIMRDPAWFYPSYWHYPMQYPYSRPVVIHKTHSATSKSGATKKNR